MSGFKVLSVVIITQMLSFMAHAQPNSRKDNLEQAELLTNIALCSPHRAVYSITRRGQVLNESYQIYLQTNLSAQTDALQILKTAAQPPDGRHFNEAFFDVSSTCPRFRTVYSYNPSTGADGFVMWGVDLFAGYDNESSSMATQDLFCQYGGYRAAVSSKSRPIVENQTLPSQALSFTTSPETGHIVPIAVTLDQSRKPVFLSDIYCK